MITVAVFQPASAEILEQVLVKVNGDILTKTELEAKQVSALRGRINSSVDAEAMKNDDALKKMIAEVTPRILVDTIDEMLLLQLGKEKGYTRHRPAVQGMDGGHPQEPESRRRRRSSRRR